MHRRSISSLLVLMLLVAGCGTAEDSSVSDPVNDSASADNRSAATDSNTQNSSGQTADNNRSTSPGEADTSSSTPALAAEPFAAVIAAARLAKEKAEERKRHNQIRTSFKPVRVLEEHEERIGRMAASRDGSTVATDESTALAADQERPVRVWDVESGKLRATLEGHTHPIHAVAVSHDGGMVASASSDSLGDARLIVQSVAEPSTPLLDISPEQSVYHLAFSPDGKYLAGGSKKSVYVYDLETKSHFKDLGLTSYIGDSRCVNFSPDGRFLATSMKAEVALYDTTTWEVVKEFQACPYPISELHFSRDGQILGAGVRYGSFYLSPLDENPGHEWLPGTIGPNFAFSPTGDHLVVRGADQTVSIWNPKTREQLAAFRTSDELLFKSDELFAFGPEGKVLITAGGDKAVRIWNLDDVLQGPPVILDPDPVVAGEEAKLTSIALKKFTDGLALSPDGNTVYTLGADSGVLVYDTGSGERTGTWGNPAGGSERLGHSADGNTLATADGDHAIHVWDTQAEMEVFTYREHPAEIVALAVSPDGSTIISSDLNREEYVAWNSRTGEKLWTIPTSWGPVKSIAFHPDGTRVVLRLKKDVAVCDATDGRQMATLATGNVTATELAWSPDGETIAVGVEATAGATTSRAGVGLYSASGGPPQWTVPTAEASVSSITFDPAGRWVAFNALRPGVATNPGITRILDVRDGRELAAVKSGNEQIAVSPDGATLFIKRREFIERWNVDALLPEAE